MTPERTIIANALKGHRLDTMSQDSGNHCICGSDSRFDTRRGPKWNSIREHYADMVLRALGNMQTRTPGKHRKDTP